MANSSYISFLFEKYLQPIAFLVERLVSREREGLPGIKSNEVELGYCLSAILLAVVMFESFLIYVARQSGNLPVDSKFDARKFYEHLVENWQSRVDVSKVFFLRDAIAHNHVYEVASTASESGEEFVFAKRIAGGDKSFKSAVGDDGIMRGSGIDLLPSRLDRQSVKMVLSEVCAAIDVICCHEPSLSNPLNRTVVVADGRRIYFRDLQGCIQ